MSYNINSELSTDRVFNNADSFSMAFDEAWEKHKNNCKENTENRLESVFLEIADHPFVINSPEIAKEVAAFRIRLLNLS